MTSASASDKLAEIAIAPHLLSTADVLAWVISAAVIFPSSTMDVQPFPVKDLLPKEETGITRLLVCLMQLLLACM